MRRFLAILAAGSIVLGACSSDDSFAPQTIDDFVVIPNQTELSLTQDDSVLVSAIVVDTVYGGHMLSPALSWTSDDPAVATVESTDGGKWRVRAIGGGETQIHVVFEAAKGPVEGTISVAVEAVPADVFTLSTATLSLHPGDTTTLGITLKDADGNDLSHHRINWANSADSIATVGLDGFVTALGTGNTTLTATVEGIEQTVDVIVSLRPVDTITLTPDLAALHVGDTMTLAATLEAANGERLEGRDIVWATSDPTIATVDEQGAVRAVGAGTATIVAASGGKTGRATIYVQ